MSLIFEVPRSGGGELARRGRGSYDPSGSSPRPRAPRLPPRVFSISICAARFSFNTAMIFSCAPRSEKSGCDKMSDLNVKCRNRDVTKVGHYRKMLKSSPRPARGIFPYGGGGPRAGTPCQGGASVPGRSGWGLSEGSEVPPRAPSGPPSRSPPRGRGPAGGTARPFLAPPAGEGVRRGPRAPRAR